MRISDVTDTDIANILYLYKQKYGREWTRTTYEVKVIYARHRGVGTTASEEDEAILEDIHSDFVELK